MPNVYILTGSTGEYSDYHSWTVAVYFDQSSAEAERDRLNQWCIENGVSRTAKRNVTGGLNKKCPGDPYFQSDYTGTEYTVEESELR